MRKLFIYIAASLDGYIAAPGDDLGFLNAMEKEGEDYGYNAFITEVDTVILGRRTYDWVLEHLGYFSHKDKEAYIITRTTRPKEGNTTFYNGDLKELVTALKEEEGKHIFCDGGAQIVHQLLKEDLVDEIIVSLIPILLGDGTRLFNDGRPQMPLQLVNVTSFSTGLVQLHYKRA
ncbi:MAG TPA: dihydrofolate reductase family protein [Saprospiraceae bacterium]|jgi:dihydrofolate reductase